MRKMWRRGGGAEGGTGRGAANTNIRLIWCLHKESESYYGVHDESESYSGVCTMESL